MRFQPTASLARRSLVLRVLVCTSVFKPRIEVSPVIAYDPSKDKLWIKTINRGRRQITDIQIRGYVQEVRRSGVEYGGKYTVYRAKIPLPSRVALGSIRNYGNPWKISPITSFSIEEAKHIITLLSESTDNERRLVIILSANDALSGTKVVKMVTYRADCIVTESLNGEEHSKSSPPRALSRIVKKHQQTQTQLRNQSSEIPLSRGQHWLTSRWTGRG
jgi:hypothetical protein